MWHDDGVHVDVVTPSVPVSAKRYESGRRLRRDWADEYLTPSPTRLYIVLDWHECSMAHADGDRVLARFSEESRIGGKHNKGGMSQQRFERNHDLAVLQWFRSIEAVALDIVRRLPTTEVVIGGPGMSKRAWLDGLRSNSLKSLCRSETYNTGYTDEHQGIRELVAYSDTYGKP